MLHIDSLTCHDVATIKPVLHVILATALGVSQGCVNARLDHHKVNLSTARVDCHPWPGAGGQLRALVLQVKSNPEQVGFVNCGLFAGLHVEVFCMHAYGEFHVTHKGTAKERVTCDGPGGGFLHKRASWFTEEDVEFTRQLLRVLFIVLSRRSQFSTVDSAIAHTAFEKEFPEAWASLEEMASENLPSPEELWYAF